jgi:hypothetical protein
MTGGSGYYSGSSGGKPLSLLPSLPFFVILLKLFIIAAQTEDRGHIRVIIYKRTTSESFLTSIVFMEFSCEPIELLEEVCSFLLPLTILS